jgi:hypothetical protein
VVNRYDLKKVSAVRFTHQMFDYIKDMACQFNLAMIKEFFHGQMNGAHLMSLGEAM